MSNAGTDTYARAATNCVTSADGIAATNGTCHYFSGFFLLAFLWSRFINQMSN